MNLLLFAGLGDPDNPVMQKSFEILIEEAKANNINETIIVKYPGHISYDLVSELTPTTTYNVMREKIIEYEAKQEEYMIFCRSYGCSPFLKLLVDMQDSINFLKKAIIWGSHDFASLYETGVENWNNTYKKSLDKGARIAKNIFYDLYPIELSIKKLKVNFPLIFCSGSDDKGYPVEFHNYLKSINKNQHIQFPTLIANEDHIINTRNNDYFKIIFNNIFNILT